MTSESACDDHPPVAPDPGENGDSPTRIVPSPSDRYPLPKFARMPAGGPYARVFQVRKIVSDDTISLHVRPNGLAWHRLGLGVAKKMFRRAVARNYVKRLIREAFRLERPGFGGGLDIVVRPKIRELTREGLRTSLRKLVPKAERKFLDEKQVPADSPSGPNAVGDEPVAKTPPGDETS